MMGLWWSLLCRVGIHPWWLVAPLSGLIGSDGWVCARCGAWDYPE